MKTAAALIWFLVLVIASVAFCHCQVPCGIYDDEMRFDMMNEHVISIERAMQQIEELSSAKKPNYNQIVRWVNMKEDHADELIHVVTWYFMNQRLKTVRAGGEGYDRYIDMLTTLHDIMIHAMRAKQTTDLEYVENLKVLVKRFNKAYMGE